MRVAICEHSETHLLESYRGGRHRRATCPSSTETADDGEWDATHSLPYVSIQMAGTKGRMKFPIQNESGVSLGLSIHCLLSMFDMYVHFG